MYSVIVVDDESIIRNVVKNAIEWEKIGFEIIGEAANGRDAYNIALELHPDLMIIDINIPFMDGITLSSNIKQNCPDTEIIILTGYDSFEYTKGAIKVGVASYVLKPLNSEELLSEVQIVKNKIDDKKRRQIYIKSLEMKEESEKIIRKQTVMKSLIDGSESLNIQEINSYLDTNDLRFLKGEIVVIIIQIGKIESYEEINDKPLWKFAVQNISEEVLSEKCENMVIDYSDNTIIAIVNAINNNLLNSIIQCSERIIFFTKKYIGIILTIAIGNKKSGISDINSSYVNAQKLLERKFIEGKGKVYYGSLPSVDYGEYREMANINKDKILLNLRIGNKKDLVSDINSLFNSVVDKKLSTTVIQLNVGNIIESLLQYLHEINADKNILLNKNLNIYDEMKENETVTELKEWLLGLVDRLFALTENYSSMKNYRLVEKTKQYIETNYGRSELSLTDISNNLYTNPSYLSKIFKQTTQLTVGEYIRNTKLQKAKAMFDQEKQIKVKTVAETVGYSDALYFSKLFKAKYGVSPKKYLKNK